MRECHCIGINHHLFLENWTLDLGLNTLVPVMPLMNRCCLTALTYEGSVSGLGVWNSCSFQLIFNYPGSHEGGYRRGRARDESWRADSQASNMAEVKLIKNRKWPPIIVGIIPHYTDGQWMFDLDMFVWCYYFSYPWDDWGLVLRERAGCQ